MSEKYLIAAAILIFIVAFFLGWLFGKKVHKTKPDGVLIIGRNEDRDVFRWVFDEELEDFKNRKQLCIKVEHSQNSQLV